MNTSYIRNVSNVISSYDEPNVGDWIIPSSIRFIKSLYDDTTGTRSASLHVFAVGNSLSLGVTRSCTNSRRG